MYLPADPVLIAAAVIPAVILLIRIYKADRLEKEPTGLLVSLVLMGVLATVPAIALEQVGSMLLEQLLTENSLAYNAILYFVIVAYAEEGSKYLLLRRRTWYHPAFNCQFDGVVYAVFVSLGFALWENIGYVAMYGFSTALLRAVTAIPGHACFGVFMGVWYGAAKKYDARGDLERARTCRFHALCFSALLHGAYDFVATLGGLFSVIFYLFVAVLFLVALRTVKRASADDDYIDGEPPTFF
mgnify:CR=1 FL=1